MSDYSDSVAGADRMAVGLACIPNPVRGDLDMVCALRAEVERLRRIEDVALIWSAYQDDDSKRDQARDPQLRRQAADAELYLYEALLA